MPFTPYHFGPGLFVKGLAARWFSWIAFVAVQVVIDCETLYYLERREYPIHRTLHTFLGGTLAGLAVAAGAGKSVQAEVAVVGFGIGFGRHPACRLFRG